MQFLMTVLEEFLPGGTRSDVRGSATPNEAETIDTFNARLASGSHLIFAGGLTSPDQALVLDNRGGEGPAIEGTVLDTAEAAGGFWIIEAEDDATARDLAAAASSACNRRIELRPLL